MAKESMIDYLAESNKGILEWVVEDGTLIKCCTFEKEVVVPEDITAIGDKAFYICKRLETVRIPDTVTRMGKTPFYLCDHLKNVHIPAHLLEGMDSITAMWMFSDNIWNHPSKEYDFMVPVLEEREDYSPGFRDLFLRQLRTPFDAVFWIRRAIQENKPQWVRKILELNEQLPSEKLDACIRQAAEEGKAEISAMLLNYRHTHLEDGDSDFLLDF